MQQVPQDIEIRAVWTGGEEVIKENILEFHAITLGNSQYQRGSWDFHLERGLGLLVTDENHSQFSGCCFFLIFFGGGFPRSSPHAFFGRNFCFVKCRC